MHYKNMILPHNFFADFVVYESIILEVKSVKAITDEVIAQSINDLKVSNNKLALIVNFGQIKLQSKRIVI